MKRLNFFALYLFHHHLMIHSIGNEKEVRVRVGVRAVIRVGIGVGVRVKVRVRVSDRVGFGVRVGVDQLFQHVGEQ